MKLISHHQAESAKRQETGPMLSFNDKRNAHETGAAK